MKKKLYAKPLFNLTLHGWLFIQNFFIVIGSVCTYALTDYLYHRWFLHTTEYDPIISISMIFPMGLLLYFMAHAFNKTIYQYIDELIHAIDKISSGDFHVRLDETKGGPLTDIYKKFNIMGTELSGIETMRNDFINEFSHEFKTPLSSIKGFSQLLLEGDCTKEETAKYLSIIASESERLVSLTGEQLLLSKLDAQQIVTEKENFLLDEQIRQCIILLFPEWSKKDIDFSIELDAIPFCGNADLLQHIWANIITNAVKYTPIGGEISVTSSLEKNSIHISISDTGIGMTEEEIGHIWDRYYRTKSTGQTKGLGLGLPIAKRVAEMNGGRIEVKSSPNVGSIFTVILPNE